MEISLKINTGALGDRAKSRRTQEAAEKRGKPTWKNLEGAGRSIEILGVPYGGHLEGRDSDGEAFYGETDIVLNKGDEVPLTYYHGYGPDEPFAMQDPPEIIGVAKYRGETKDGHIFDAILDPTTPLGSRVIMALDAGQDVKASSGAVSHLVRMGPAGLINVWPVGEMAVFDTNEWRQPANQFATVNAKARDLSPAGGEGQDGDSPNTLQEETQPIKSQKEFIPMSDNTPAVDNALMDAIAEIKNTVNALASDVTELKAHRPAPAPAPEGAAKNGAPAVVKSLGEVDEKSAFLHYIRTGERLKGTKAAMQEGTASEGGYAVPDDELRRIIAKRDEASIPRQMGVTAFTTSRDVFNVPTEATSLTKFGIVAEEGAISGAEEEPTLGQVAITIYKFVKLIKVSEELLEDDNANLEAFLMDALGRAWAETENYYSLIGSGSGQPQGAVVGGTLGKTFASNAAITAAELSAVKYALPQAYRDNSAAWVMDPSTEGYIRALTGSSFQFQSTPAGTGTRSLETLMGFPVFNSAAVADIGTVAKSVLFGNWAYYALVTNKALRVRRLNELYAGNGQVGILATVRMGGAVLQSEAFVYGQHPV